MKKKVLISFLVILLILTLTDCAITPELTDRFLAEEAVYNYWQAIINRQYGLAECFCIYDGIWYSKIASGKNISILILKIPALS